MDERLIKKNELYLLVRNNESVLYEGPVKALTSFNEKGKFDIMPMHTNFISIIKDKIIIRQLQGPDAVITIAHGILKVTENNVHVFLGVDNLA